MLVNYTYKYLSCTSLLLWASSVEGCLWLWLSNRPFSLLLAACQNLLLLHFVPWIGTLMPKLWAILYPFLKVFLCGFVLASKREKETLTVKVNWGYWNPSLSQMKKTPSSAKLTEVARNVLVSSFCRWQLNSAWLCWEEKKGCEEDETRTYCDWVPILGFMLCMESSHVKKCCWCLPINCWQNQQVLVPPLQIGY